MTTRHSVCHFYSTMSRRISVAELFKDPLKKIHLLRQANPKKNPFSHQRLRRHFRATISAVARRIFGQELSWIIHPRLFKIGRISRYNLDGVFFFCVVAIPHMKRVRAMDAFTIFMANLCARGCCANVCIFYLQKRENSDFYYIFYLC